MRPAATNLGCELRTDEDFTLFSAVTGPIPMTTYVYETIPQKPNTKPVRFEVRQSMNDAPLTAHPTTGEPVRRVIAGGYGVIAQKSAPPPQPCSSQCGCFGAN